MNTGEIITELPKGAIQDFEIPKLFSDEESFFTRIWRGAEPIGAFEFRKFEKFDDAKGFIDSEFKKYSGAKLKIIQDTNKVRAERKAKAEKKEKLC